MRRLAFLLVILTPTAAKTERMTIYDSSNRMFGYDEHNGDRSLSPNERSNGRVNSYNSSDRRTGPRSR